MDKVFKIESVVYDKHITPEGSCGTGYSQYDVVVVTFSNGEQQSIMLSTWYTPKEIVSEDFVHALKYRVCNIDESLTMLHNALPY